MSCIMERPRRRAPQHHAEQRCERVRRRVAELARSQQLIRGGSGGVPRLLPGMQAPEGDDNLDDQPAGGPARTGLGPQIIGVR
ncbi:hypothetical protein [Kitasatospora herbaricolor]|uniref:hypothetical protein n=1 Tax=Kitasatospora herbaricolor TaxID=68217 RepID=UPI0036DA2995